MMELTKESILFIFHRDTMVTYVNILKFLPFESCVQHCRPIETQSNQSTNEGVRQQCECLWYEFRKCFSNFMISITLF